MNARRINLKALSPMHHSPTYQIEDILYIGRGILLPALSHPGTAERTFATMLEELNARPEVTSYASVAACEELDMAAGFLRLVSVYNAELRDDLAFSTGKLNLINLAILLSLFAPQGSDKAFYDRLMGHVGQKAWLLEIADAPLIKRVSDQAHNMRQMIKEFQKRIANIDLPDVEIWKISDAPKDALDRFRAQMKTKYKEGGTVAAEAFIEENLARQDTRLSRYLRYSLRR